MDVHVHVGLFGHLQAVLEGEAVAASDAEAGHEQIDVGTAVGGAKFDGLFVAEVDVGQDDVAEQALIGEAAVREGQRVFLVTQRSVAVEDPDRDDLFEMGVIASVKQLVQSPDNKILNISTLSQIFDNTTATYKFYWFVALLDIVVKERKTKMSFWEIIAGMLAESWYPIHYFKLSFGKSDSLFDKSLEIQNTFQISIESDKEKIKKYLLENLNETKRFLRVFTINVPYRFLSPWIKYTYDDDVVAKSQRFENSCLYAIYGDEIVINDNWVGYLTEHYSILRDFTFWNLTEFLQKRNPNVPDVPSKLIKPIQRDSLTKQRQYWNTYIETVGSLNCIYTGKQIFARQYDLDHFVPWSFVSHNLLWNLIPADSSINSSKSNNLPPLEKYLRPFANIQQNAIKTLYNKNPNNTILEDYLIVYDSVSDLVKLSEPDFYNVFRRTFSPMVQIAENMGFKYWQQ